MVGCNRVGESVSWWSMVYGSVEDVFVSRCLVVGWMLVVGDFVLRPKFMRLLAG